MPTFSCCSAVRQPAPNFSLVLNARHVLDAGTPSQVIRTRGRFPEDMDVSLGSDLVFTLAGLLDGTKVSPAAIQHSAMAHQTLRYLRTNMDQLGLSAVSDIYIDEDDGHAKFSVSSSRSLRPRVRPVDVRLIAIHLVYACKSTSRDTPVAEGANPFAVRVYLPLASALDRVLEKFVSLHLVRRYPLIFGPWRAKLDRESPYVLHIVRSITSIAERSTNASFRKKFRRSCRVIEGRYSSAMASSMVALQDLLGTSGGLELSNMEDDDTTVNHSTSDILCQSLERLFRVGIRPARFKGALITPTIDDQTADSQHDFDLSEADDVGMDSSPMEDMFQDEMCEDNNIATEDFDGELELSDDDAASATDEDWLREIPLPTLGVNLRGCPDDQLAASQDISVSSSSEVTSLQHLPEDFFARSTGNCYTSDYCEHADQLSEPLDLPLPLTFDDDDMELRVNHQQYWADSLLQPRRDDTFVLRTSDAAPTLFQACSYPASIYGVSPSTVVALEIGSETLPDCLDYSESLEQLFPYGNDLDQPDDLDMDLHLSDDEWYEDSLHPLSGSRSASSGLTTPESSQNSSDRHRTRASYRIDGHPHGGNEAAPSYSNALSPANSAAMGPDCREADGEVREMVLEFEDEDSL
ncbi:hypothetical protein B0H21DRAFT_749530 [Amylocystis lapponica]|nr:hypothetical protein B0H21DRAFT_749530 [Amylocystis lapponica]